MYINEPTDVYKYWVLLSLLLLEFSMLLKVDVEKVLRSHVTAAGGGSSNLLHQ